MTKVKYFTVAIAAGIAMASPANASYWDLCGVYRPQYTEAGANSAKEVNAELSCDKIPCRFKQKRRACFDGVAVRASRGAVEGERK
jgi:hypothetical protein